MITEITAYSGFELTRISVDSPDDLRELTGQYIRVEMKPNRNTLPQMAGMGYLWADRTIGVTINLKRSALDYDKMVRFSMREALPENKAAVLRIAQSEFKTDTRFHVRPVPDKHVANVILEDWVNTLSNCYACIYKDDVIGFIDLEPVSDREAFVHLAAVEERYRASGAALSMYAYAISQAKMKGYQKVSGRISSSNTAVMNLYTYLGGAFSEPLDVFLKEGIE